MNGLLKVPSIKFTTDSTFQVSGFTEELKNQITVNKDNIQLNKDNIQTNTNQIFTNSGKLENVSIDTDNKFNINSDVIINNYIVFKNQTINYGSIGQYSQDPNSQAMTIQSINSIWNVSPLIYLWSPNIVLGNSTGGTVNILSSNTNRGSLNLNKLKLFGSTTDTDNGYIELNDEIQNYAFTDELKNKILNLEIQLSNLQNSINSLSVIPTGTIITFSGYNVPIGYLLCDGRILLKTDYQNLYNLIANAYSQNRITPVPSGYFALPDLRGCAIMGAGQNQSYIRKITTATKPLGLFSEMSIQDHSHLVYVNGGAKTVATGGTSGTTQIGYNDRTEYQTVGIYNSDGTIMEAGITQPDNVAVNFCIKY